MISNPDYAPDTYAKYTDLEYVGFELWTVNAGSVFDNVLVTDDKAYATKMAAETWGKIKEGESDAFDAWKKANEVSGVGERLLTTLATLTRARGLLRRTLPRVCPLAGSPPDPDPSHARTTALQRTALVCGGIAGGGGDGRGHACRSGHGGGGARRALNQWLILIGGGLGME